MTSTVEGAGLILSSISFQLMTWDGKANTLSPWISLESSMEMIYYLQYFSFYICLCTIL